MKVANRTRTGRTSEEAVRSATGRSREEWFSLLDSWDAAGHKHRDIAAWIMREHGVNNWWAQTLTVDLSKRVACDNPAVVVTAHLRSLRA